MGELESKLMKMGEQHDDEVEDKMGKLKVKSMKMSKQHYDEIEDKMGVFKCKAMQYAFCAGYINKVKINYSICAKKL